ncbi:glycerophosphoryl diester phosphodiesterase membrane domain-containing protein [Qipengyuania zhejiangensis]|uniref:glycerophosphoryl diester phosphodiesterase membrane domain-containing protein n=1 Tax=Qipengyuania zhejiangensis TaxID=3077782 RepID=UPI002D77C925|nr:glycerophosphoryl diester phosphodiesterase membrane domain-containing protein [Qipengyuania sp. Z2]
MKFDLDTAWRDAKRFAGANSGLLSAIAGIFVFLPYAILLVTLPSFAPMPEIPEGASMERVMDAFNAFYARTWWLFMLVAAIGTVGQLAMLALVGRRASPTVSEAIGIGAKFFVPAWLALVLQMLGINFATLLIVSVATLTGLGGVAFAATVLAFAVAVYLTARLSMTLPIFAVDGEINPIAALRGSWNMTRGNGRRLSFFYFLLVVAAFALFIVVLLVSGLILSLTGPAVAEVGEAVTMAAMTTAVVVGATAVLAAVHRQFRRLENATSVPTVRHD